MRTIKIVLCQSSEQAAMPCFYLCRNNTICNFNACFSLQRASCLMLSTSPGSPPASALLANTYKQSSSGHASCSFKIRNTRHELFCPTCTELHNLKKKKKKNPFFQRILQFLCQENAFIYKCDT